MMTPGVRTMGDRNPEPPADGDVFDIVRFRARKTSRSATEPRGAAPPRRSSSASPERIARLKREIASGDYRPDPEEIARKLLENGF